MAMEVLVISDSNELEYRFGKRMHSIMHSTYQFGLIMFAVTIPNRLFSLHGSGFSV